MDGCQLRKIVRSTISRLKNERIYEQTDIESKTVFDWINEISDNSVLGEQMDEVHNELEDSGEGNLAEYRRLLSVGGKWWDIISSFVDNTDVPPKMQKQVVFGVVKYYLNLYKESSSDEED